VATAAAHTHTDAADERERSCDARSRFHVISAALRCALHVAFSSAGLPVTKQPSGLFRSDGKRPDVLTFVPWSSSKASCWDVTITCPLADSYVTAAVRESGAAAELAASCKEDKYAALDGRYIFEPIDIETLGVFNTSARQLLSNLGRKISESTGEAREASSLFQRCSVLVQRFNAILLHDSLPAYDCTD